MVICGLVAVTACLHFDKRAECRATESKCIEVAHIGSQDTPVGSVRLCAGEKGRSRADSLLENKWTFYFEMSTYSRLQEFVVTNAPKRPIDAGSGPASSFAVTWFSKNGKDRYVVSPELKCTYVSNLVHTVTGPEYAEFRRVGEDMMAREGCRPKPVPAR
jgi:hypothetical protein